MQIDADVSFNLPEMWAVAQLLTMVGLASDSNQLQPRAV